MTENNGNSLPLEPITDLLAPVEVGNGTKPEDDDPGLLPVVGSMTDVDEDDAEEELERLIKQDLVFAEQQRVGPLLAELRSQQAEGSTGNRESYSVEHLRRLYQFVPKRLYRKPGGPKQYCSKVHEKPCLECVTCHFCRQRTTEQKTSCSKCAGVNSYYGGPGRGIWCGACRVVWRSSHLDFVVSPSLTPACSPTRAGSCLQGRIGENIHEVLDNPDWICPCCRDICNCSGVNCMRLKRGWFPTNQLSREAGDQGYKSVAHYLILTHLSEHASVEAIGAGLANARRRARRLGLGVRRRQGAGVKKGRIRRDSSHMTGMREGGTVGLEDSDVGETGEDRHGNGGDNVDNAGNGGLGRRQRPKYIQEQLPMQYQGMKTRREALEIASKPRLELEISIILKDLGRKDAGSSVLDGMMLKAPDVGGQTRFLCLLDEDDCDEEEEDADADAWVGPNLGATSGSCPPAGPAADSCHRPVESSAGALASSAYGVSTSSGFACTMMADPAIGSVPASAVANNVLYGNGGGNQVVETVSVSRVAHKTAEMRVCDDMLPPRRPKAKRRCKGNSLDGVSGARQGAASSMSKSSEARTTSIRDLDRKIVGVESGNECQPTDESDVGDESDDEQPEDDVFWLNGGNDDRNWDDYPVQGDVRVDDGRQIADHEHENAGRLGTHLPPAGAQSVGSPLPHQQGVSMDEFVWNGLCLRATSVVDAVKTFYQFHPDVADSSRLQGAEADRMLYDDVYESTRSGLQRVLKAAEGLLTQEAVVYYQSTSDINLAVDVASGIANDNRRISTVGGLRRAVQLFSFLSRILPHEDVTWRIEKRLLGMEPFADFDASSPHAKAVLLRGWLEYVTILEKRGMDSVDALTSIGNALGAIATEMKTALPLIDAIIDNSPMPTENVAISGWSYDEAARGKKLIEVFTDLSVLYASLHEVLVAGIQRATETSIYLGPKSHRMLTLPFVKTLLDPQGSFPAAAIRHGFTFICTIIDVALKSFDDEGMSITVEERNALGRDRDQLLDLVESAVLPDLEALVQLDYNMWGSASMRRSLNSSINTGKQGIGSEKVEVLARCYALRLRSGRTTWAAVEAKATEPYSFSQYWKYANLRYRHFSLYLLAHALEHAPLVLQPPGGGGATSLHVASILRMWLLSLLDFGRHECAWYLTTIISKHTSFLPSPVDFRGDKSGRKAATMLASFAQSISGNQALVRGVVLTLDDCLQERQREIVQTAFNADRAVLKWHRATSRALLAFLAELQGDLRRERELLKLLRRCVIWTIQDLSMLKAAADVEHGSDGGLDSLCGLRLGYLGAEATRGSIEGDLRQVLESFEFSRLVTILPRALDDEVECHEPLWVFISGIIGLGDASMGGTPFERVLNDKVAASLFATGCPSNYGGMVGLPLHRHVLGTHVRRVLTKTNFINSQNERLGVSAMRFVRAILSRPEMRATSAFEGTFDMMLTTWISLMSQTSPAADSLAVRFELVEVLKDSIRLHGDILVSSHLHREFWKVVCSECLRMVSARFPEAVRPSFAMEAEFIFCHVLATHPGLECFVASTPSMMSAAYNNALSEVGRPPSLDVLDRITGSHNLADILPRVYGARQREGSLRPGDFAWNLSRASIGLLDAMLEVEGRGKGPASTSGQVSTLDTQSGVTQSSTPGVWYPLCCLPYLESVARKGERAYILIQKECETFFERLESKAPGVRVALPAKQEQPAMLPPHMRAVSQMAPSTEEELSESKWSATGSSLRTSRIRSGSPAKPLRSVGDVDRLDLNTTFAISGQLLKIRKLQRDGLKVAACTLCDGKTSRAGVPSELNILVSKPDALVASLLDPSSAPSKLPLVVMFRGIELVRKKNPVARSTPVTTVEFGPETWGGPGSADIRPTSATVFIEASKELVRMGYSLDLVTRCLQTLQKHAQALSQEMIVSRVVSMLND